MDDDQDALDMLTVVLTEAGAAVRTAASPTEALALLRWIRPDGLVSDLAMPDEDGYSLIRNLRAIERESGRETPRWPSPPTSASRTGPAPRRRAPTCSSRSRWIPRS